VTEPGQQRGQRLSGWAIADDDHIELRWRHRSSPLSAVDVRQGVVSAQHYIERYIYNY
jgi:hypothetical protein